MTAHTIKWLQGAVISVRRKAIVYKLTQAGKHRTACVIVHQNFKHSKHTTLHSMLKRLKHFCYVSSKVFGKAER